MVVGLLISVMIAIVVGVVMIPTVMSVMEGEENSSEILNATPTAMNTVVSILPYIFVGVILLGALAWVGGGGPAEQMGTWAGQRLRGRQELLGPTYFSGVEALPEARGEVKEMTIIEAEITPKEKLRSDEVGW